MQANGIYKTIFLRSLTAFADRLGSARFIQFLDRDRRARVPSPWEPDEMRVMRLSRQTSKCSPFPLGFGVERSRIILARGEFQLVLGLVDRCERDRPVCDRIGAKRRWLLIGVALAINLSLSVYKSESAREYCPW